MEKTGNIETEYQLYYNVQNVYRFSHSWLQNRS